MKIRHIAAILALLVLALLPLPARADVIWEPQDGFYAAHADECTYVNDRYLSPGGVEGVVSPEDGRALCTFPEGWELRISFVYEDAGGAAWGVYEEGEESCWVRLDALQKVYDRDDFFTDHAEAITPYADELADFVPQGTVYLWEYPGSGELYGKLSPEDLTQADFLPYDAVYVDEQGQTWVYIPYLYGREGWICCADPENASLPATAPQAAAAAKSPAATDAPDRGGPDPPVPRHRRGGGRRPGQRRAARRARPPQAVKRRRCPMFLDVIVFPWEFFAPGLAGLAFALVAVVVAVTLLLLRRK